MYGTGCNWPVYLGTAFGSDLANDLGNIIRWLCITGIELAASPKNDLFALRIAYLELESAISNKALRFFIQQ